MRVAVLGVVVAAVLAGAATAVPAWRRAHSEATDTERARKVKVVKAKSPPAVSPAATGTPAATAAPSRAGPPKADPATADPTKPDPANPDPAKSDPAKAGSAKAGAPKAGPGLYRPITYAELPAWERDDHLAAFQTFLKSCGRVIARGREGAEVDVKGPRPPPPALVAVCVAATGRGGEITSAEDARAFFEENFTPNAVVKKGQPGLLTGYYEPVLEGSRTPEGRFQTPIYKRPPDLVNVVDDTQRGILKPGALTHLRKTATGTEPYYTRAEIDGGALKGKGLELLYLADSVDVFFMQIQGSGRVHLTDGTTVRVHYDGKNGHPYSSIGRYLIEKAILAADRMSMGALAAWLRADPERGRQVMWQNSSYVFFREIKDDVGSPLGAIGVPLTPARSLAIDPSYHALGTPIYVSVPTMKHVPNAVPFNRL
ncbi:MAG: MltA domain-containing protein, partial [Hyphomicrobiaceae bacterium]|nr:MltA domain-containing protein [Hyphomicrobiaceae bacterium]